MLSTSPYADWSVIYRVDGRRTAWREVDSEAIVLDLKSAVYFGLNRSACALWPRLIAGSTCTELIDVLLNSSPTFVSRAQAATEISDFLAALDVEHLLQSEHFV